MMQVWVAFLALAVQGEEAGDPLEDLPYREQYEKAVEYVLKNNGRNPQLVPGMLAGFIYLTDPRPEMKQHLEATIRDALYAYKETPDRNRNWFVTWSGFFLACVYLKERRANLKGALEEWAGIMEANIESTGGWGHAKGFAEETGYHMRGGSIDLAILTTTAWSTLLMMKKAGIEVSEELLGRVEKNLQGIGGAGGFAYGSSNPSGDRALSRAAMAYLGVRLSGHETKLLRGFENNLPRSVQGTEAGHAYGPIHFFGVAMALSLMGRFKAMGDHWLPKLAKRQDADGAVVMKNDGGKDGEERHVKNGRVGSTGVFALMILLQKFKWIQTPEDEEQKKRAAEREEKKKKRKAGGSPFQRKKKSQKE